VSLWLEIEDFLNPFLREDVMISPYPFVEAQTPQQVTELIKRDVCIGGAAQYASEQFAVPGHTVSYTTFEALCLDIMTSVVCEADLRVTAG